MLCPVQDAADQVLTSNSTGLHSLRGLHGTSSAQGHGTSFAQVCIVRFAVSTMSAVSIMSAGFFNAPSKWQLASSSSMHKPHSFSS